MEDYKLKQRNLRASHTPALDASVISSREPVLTTIFFLKSMALVAHKSPLVVAHKSPLVVLTSVAVMWQCAWPGQKFMFLPVGLAPAAAGLAQPFDIPFDIPCRPLRAPMLLMKLRGGVGGGGGARTRRNDSPAGDERMMHGLRGSGRRGRSRKKASSNGEKEGVVSERAMEYLPAELRVQSGQNVDEWGRHHTHSPATFAQDSPHRNTTLDAASPGSLSSRRGKKGKSRKMITFDLAELFPRCKGLNINFTSPLTPTAAELQAAVQAVQVRCKITCAM